MSNPTDGFDDLRLTLSGDDADALDALIDAGGELDSVVPALRDRAERVDRLLQLLGPAADHAPESGGKSSQIDNSDAQSLIDMTYLRVLRHARSTHREPALSPRDGDALDVCVAVGWSTGRIPKALRDRADRHRRLADLVTAPARETPDASRSDLVDRTLQQVQAAIDAESEAMRIERRRGLGFSRGRLADVVSVAAVLLIAVSIIWPVMGALNEQASRATCLSNMHAAAAAMSTYAGDNMDHLPVASASLAGNAWWNVGGGPGQSNSANLYHLTRSDYIPLHQLACPNNAHARRVPASPTAQDWQHFEEVSYSYQIMFGQSRPAWGGTPGRVVVMADRSPVVLRAVRGELIRPMENSLNHGGSGQHVLYNDGSAAWITSPVLDNGDNIWLPRSVQRLLEAASGAPMLHGNELPTAADDSFVGP